MDEHIFRLIYNGAHGSATLLMVGFTLMGSGWTMLALVPLFLTRHRRLAVILTSLLAVTAALVALLKMAVNRARPCEQLAGVRALWGQAPTDPSFPSGHSAGGFAVALFVVSVMLGEAETRVEAWRWWISGLFLACAACIALSRVYLGVHFPADVVAGGLLGAAIGALGGTVYRQSGRP
jgi:undecaprenyl-diphosphatase